MHRPTGLPDHLAALTTSTSRRVLLECIRYHPSRLSSRIHSRRLLFLAGTSTIVISSCSIIGGRPAWRCARVSSPCHFRLCPASLPVPVFRSVSSPGSLFRREPSQRRPHSRWLR